MKRVVAICLVAILSMGGGVAVAQESVPVSASGVAPAYTEEVLAETQRSRLVREAVRLAPILADMLSSFANNDISREQIEIMIESAIDNLDDRFTGIESRFDSFEARLEGIERNQELIVTLLQR